MKQSQTLRVTQGNTSFYCTAKQIRQGVGSSEQFNTACQQALEHLISIKAIGVINTFNQMTIQLDIV